MPQWKTCYACGTPLEGKKAVANGPATRLITSFEDKNPFENGTIVAEHATDGTKSLRMDKDYIVMLKPQDWRGYDFLETDVYTDSKVPVPFYAEFYDAQTRDYWTRVNYTTVIPPGQSTLILPLKQLYVGEKSRPGRPLELGSITKMVYAIGDKPPAPVYIDNLRLRRDDSPSRMVFDGLYAFDFGLSTSPVMEGFTPLTQGTIYSRGRGYGLKDAKVWRSFDVMQPEPLYEDFICIESGSLAVDVPNGRYRVFVNIDNPSGFWGEYQVYRKRAILAQGKPVVTETMDFDAFKKKYFRFWNVEDLPTDNTFDKYQKAYFHEKMFDVDVTNGQLQIGFEGENFGCSVSAVVIFPVAKAAEGERFLKWVEGKRRFYFDNYFKRVLHPASGDPLKPTAEDQPPRLRCLPSRLHEGGLLQRYAAKEGDRRAAFRRGLCRRVSAADHVDGAVEGLGPGDRDRRRPVRPCGRDPRQGDRRGLCLLPRHARDDGGERLHDQAAVRDAGEYG